MKVCIRLFFIVFCILIFYKSEAKSYRCISEEDTTNIEKQFSTLILTDIDTFRVPYIKGKYWKTSILKFRSNLTFILDSGVVLHVQKGIFPLDTISYGLIRVNNLHHVSIIGYGATIQFDIHEYSAGEWRHCIFLEGANTVYIYGLSIVECSGDAICINWNSAVAYSKNIFINDIVCDANARQGISIISAKNVYIENCIFKNTGKKNHLQLALAGPWAGIDLEPDDDSQFLENINITNCVFENNKGDGFLVAFGGQINTVKLKYNQFFNNKRSALAFIGKLRGIKGSFSIKETSVWGKQECVFYIRDWNSTNQKIAVNQLSIQGSQIDKAFNFVITPQVTTPTFGNFTCKRLTLSQWGSKEIMVIEGENKTRMYQNILIKGVSNNTIRESEVVNIIVK